MNGATGGATAGNDDIGRRLDALEARAAILELEGRYSRTWDTGDGAGWAGCFAEDGVFEMAAAGPDPGQQVVGRAALERFCLDYTATTTGLHMLHLPEIEVAGDAATSRIHFEFRSVRRDAEDFTQQAGVTGYYEVTYRRTAEGWRMARRFEKAVARQRVMFFDL